MVLPPTMLDDREKRLAALAWGVSGAFGPLIPLFVFALNYKRSKFIAFHALQAALSFVSLIVVSLIAGVAVGGWTAVVLLRDGVPGPDTPMPEGIRILMLVAGGLTVAVYLGLIVLSLRFARRAGQGEWVAYPVASRFAATLYDISDIRVPVNDR